MLPVRMTCGPAQRSRKSPFLKYVMGSPLGNGFEIANLKLARIAHALGQTTQPSALGILQRLFARDDNLLKGVVRLGFLFHLLLDLRKIFGRNAMLEIHVVIETVFNRRPGSELGVGPQPQNRRGHDMRGGMPGCVPARSSWRGSSRVLRSGFGVTGGC